MIILTTPQADLVRGQTRPGHALAPRPLANGTWALPESVLDDPAHAPRFRNYLMTLPRVRDDTIRNGQLSDPNNLASPIINSDYSQDADLNRRATFKNRTWAPGETIPVERT